MTYNVDEWTWAWLTKTNDIDMIVNCGHFLSTLYCEYKSNVIDCNTVLLMVCLKIFDKIPESINSFVSWNRIFWIH